ncbi:hypothetical protein J1614_007861 [Plenodomus biglobosus]|nr:hypothetical protein J1614_007861 [Plenodomus biglobosus]
MPSMAKSQFHKYWNMEHRKTERGVMCNNTCTQDTGRAAAQQDFSWAGERFRRVNDPERTENPGEGLGYNRSYKDRSPFFHTMFRTCSAWSLILVSGRTAWTPASVPRGTIQAGETSSNVRVCFV